MSTQPRMSAPIGRLQIKPSKPRHRRASRAARWSPAEPPGEAQNGGAETEAVEGTRPSFYPFPLRGTDDDER
ncbi:MAG: hypothetical protein JRE81_01475 [Deltaproteobacteria bacterium]|jgi:hypothetical protein|nr:hypothetical protein [Deltaproteobacteria bacterium]